MTKSACFRRDGFLHRLLMIMFVVGAFGGAAYAQLSVTITGPSFTSTPAPSGQFTVSASVSGSATKVVFYRNDVPFATDTSSPYELSQNQLGQETYTYRARAYDSAGAWADSSDFKLLVYTPRVVRMGDVIGSTQTHGPGSTLDHTVDVQAAVNYLDQQGGGTLVFPCKLPSNALYSFYNIRATIKIPANVTLQGESSEQAGKCRIYWHDVSWAPSAACQDNPNNGSYPLRNRPMFKIVGGKSRVRFKDLWLYSRSSGINCDPRTDWERIADEDTAGIEMNTDDTDGAGNITDIIFENVAITNFTHGIRAKSGSSSDYEISGVRVRGYRAEGNHRQVYINSRYAYNWDVQNLNLSGMMETQGAVEIVNAGRPSSYTGENGKLKFLELNCNGGPRDHPPAFCVQVEKHSGLYFRQLHHEGTNQAIIVKDISARSAPNTNPDPIVFESGVATGEFYDASMKLYLLGNAIFAAPEIAQPGLDNGRLRFFGAGINSTVMDCGDIHYDITDHDPTSNGYAFKMIFTHSERNRGSFFAQDSSGNKFTKPHTYCSQGVSGLPNVNEIGGDYFDSGILPTEAGSTTDTEKLYSNVLTTANVSTTCPSGDIAACLEDMMDYNDTTPDNGGAVYINGQFTVNRTVNIPRGSQIIGAPGAQLTLSIPENAPLADSLFKIDLPVADPFRVSGIVIRNLKLIASQSAATATGLAMMGQNNSTVGGSSDMHFSGLTIEGFNIGLYGGVFSQSTGQPMIDGVSLKNTSFVNNGTAVRIFSGNVSNWNVMNLSMASSTPNASGWNQTYGGHQGLQGVSCQGAPLYQMTDCIRLQMVGNFYLTDLKQTQQVTNALTVGETGSPFGDFPFVAPQYANLLVRNSDFTSSLTTTGRVNLIGKAFIVSLNNKYSSFNVGSNPTYQGNLSRVTYCGDTYSGGTPYAGLDERHPNNWVGVPTLTRVQCGTRPMPWDDAVRWGGDVGDKPLVGNFFNDVREDFVIYRSGSQSQFLIKQAGGTGTSTIDWGIAEDIPMIGRFFPNTRAQIVVFRPSTGYWWVKDPNTSSTYSWSWGLSEDKPFVGNFLDESGSVSGNKDEIAVYRPSTKTFYILNPRSGAWTYHTTTPDNDSKIQVGDFLGVGYDQIAQFKAGVWKIINPRNGSTYTVNFGQTDDVPVAGKYLSGACTQVGVWRPGTQEFLVADPFTSCGSRSTSMIWGSNNVYPDTQSEYDIPLDIPLTINTADGTLRRPTAYRPTVGVFLLSIANGQWFVHDPF